MITRLILTGMSGAGKSTAGAKAAKSLGWQFVDMDDVIEHQADRTIPEIFSGQGESAFRELEAKLLQVLLSEDHLVISTGGGAVCSQTAQDAIACSTGSLTVWMHAEADVLWQRVAGHKDDVRTTERPMLAARDPLARMKALLESRVRYYAQADVTVQVGNRDAERTSADLTELVHLANCVPSEVMLDTGKVQSRIQVGQGIADTLPQVIASHWPQAQAIWIGADANVAAAHADWINRTSKTLGMPVHLYEIPSGETSKSLTTYGGILDWMLTGGIQRGDVVVALGGGVVGDLMGFAAATVLRGVGLVQVPTTLLSMVDSSVGGKTGINHSTGKNLIGAFYQPPVVLVDPRFLQTVPPRELRSGFAEVIKHGVIQASTPDGENGFLTDVLAQNTNGLLELREPLTSWVLRQNISLKASVVAADEREANLRQILNFGHTIGHGIEAAGYKLLHGEAIAIGMIAAGHIAAWRGDVASEWVDQLAALIEAYSLPVSTRATRDEILIKMQSDKKKSAGRQNWVLPTADGGVLITSDVASEIISEAIDLVLKP